MCITEPYVQEWQEGCWKLEFWNLYNHRIIALVQGYMEEWPAALNSLGYALAYIPRHLFCIVVPLQYEYVSFQFCQQRFLGYSVGCHTSREIFKIKIRLMLFLCCGWSLLCLVLGSVVSSSSSFGARLWAVSSLCCVEEKRTEPGDHGC